MTQKQNNLIERRKIGVFHLAMITVAFVASIRMFPMMAEYGLSCITLYAAATLSFLLPTALISAELATAFPSRGGIYSWVKEALPGPWGFIAVWLQMLAVITTMPAYLSFDAATFSYAFMPELANNKFFLIAFILIVYWIITLISMFGMKTAGWLNTFGSFIGVFLPTMLLLILGAAWLYSGRPSNTELTAKALIPDFTFKNIMFASGLLFALTGMESSGSHALDTRNVRKRYPRAMALTCLIVFLIGFGAVSIAIVVPHKNLDVISGLMQALQAFLEAFNMGWLVPVLAVMLSLGSTVTLNSMIIGPCKSLLGTARHGDIPPVLSRVNRFGMPANLLVFQALIVSIYAAVFMLMPTSDASYCVLTSILTIAYMLLYLLLFISAIVLRYTRPDIERPYKVFGGNFGMWVISLFGFLSAVIGIIVSFFPPQQIPSHYFWFYEILLVVGTGSVIIIGFLIYRLKRPEWINKDIV